VGKKTSKKSGKVEHISERANRDGKKDSQERKGKKPDAKLKKRTTRIDHHWDLGKRNRTGKQLGVTEAILNVMEEAKED